MDLLRSKRFIRKYPYITDERRFTKKIYQAVTIENDFR